MSQDPPFQPESYWQIVTRDATPAAGSAPACAANVRAAWRAIHAAADLGPAGLANLTAVTRMCSPLGPGDINALIMFYLNAWDTMAMGEPLCQGIRSFTANSIAWRCRQLPISEYA